MVRGLALTLIASVLSFCTISAEPYFYFSTELTQAYRSVVDLRLRDAHIQVQRIKILEPENDLVHLIENYIDFFTTFIGEKEVDFEAFMSEKKRRLNAVKRGDVDSPYYLFVQAEILLQSALVRLKFEEYLGAFNEASKAYDLLEYNQKKFPYFVGNLKSLGILHALVGSIPTKYRWGLNLLGMDGSIREGQSEIEKVLNYAKQHDFVFEQETISIYAFVLLHLSKEPVKAWEVLNHPAIDLKNSLLACFVKANVALKTGRTDLAITILEERPNSEAYYQFDQLEYMLGIAKLHKLDAGCTAHFLNFITSFEGRNYIKDAYLKLAWSSLLFEDGKRYAHWLSMAKTEGGQIVDEDKSALRWASKKAKPNLSLLRSRLASDGGYFDEALSELERIGDPKTLPTNEVLEWHYRRGRILQAQNEFEKALKEFDEVLASEEVSTSYMIGNSALQKGLIYESLGQWEAAHLAFSHCLDIEIDEYRSSINQKARAGIDRVSGK